ncbi:MAG TPA: nucleoside triphosphate pyrophosphohydrolase [Nitrospirae bacterium]|nr:nucleoside triphosphate pyrophosphohydrolase [Nitrospirota bacterium]
MDRLRDKNGCPWDREQTRESLKPFLIEEAYELLEAIEENSPGKIKEEIGDLLFQLIFHARISEELGEFDIRDVLDSITEKMISRHPHVFGNLNLESTEEVVQRWEEHKKREGKLRDSVLEGVPRALPSLLRAQRVQERASRVGFDWKEAGGVLEKIEEELEEFREAVRSGEGKRMEEELGDLLFSIVNLSRFVNINPEEALRRTTDRFIRRFRYIETGARAMGRKLDELSLEEMDRLWEEAKEKE